MITNIIKICDLTYVSSWSCFTECKTPPPKTLAFLSEALKGKARISVKMGTQLNTMIQMFKKN